MDSLTHTFTIIGVLGGMFFIIFKMLREDNKRLETKIEGVRADLKNDIGRLDTKLSGEIKELRAEFHTMGERISRMDGQLYQVTQMLYFKPPVSIEDAKSIKEN